MFSTVLLGCGGTTGVSSWTGSVDPQTIASYQDLDGSVVVVEEVPHGTASTFCMRPDGPGHVRIVCTSGFYSAEELEPIGDNVVQSISASQLGEGSVAILAITAPGVSLATGCGPFQVEEVAIEQWTTAAVLLFALVTESDCEATIDLEFRLGDVSQSVSTVAT